MSQSQYVYLLSLCNFYGTSFHSQMCNSKDKLYAHLRGEWNRNAIPLVFPIPVKGNTIYLLLQPETLESSETPS